MTKDDQPLSEIHEKLLAQHRAIMDEHWVLRHKTFDAEEHRLHHIRIRQHRDALAAYVKAIAQLRELRSPV